MINLTHKELVKLSVKWLEKQHSVVITEMVSAAGETPDAIGFKNKFSTVIECKVSKSDFASDAKKFHRINSEFGMGNHRYYSFPKGMIPDESVPEKWGILEYSNGKLRCIRKSQNFHCDKGSEIILLISAIRRIGQTCPAGISVSAYNIESKRTATIGIKEND